MQTWPLYGVRGHTHEMPWAGPEPYEPKLEKLIAKIDELAEQNKEICLMGASAGASAVLNAYIQRKDKVKKIALVCPKINGPETVGDKTYNKNPAFKTSMYELQETLKELTAEDKRKIRIYYSEGDGAIPYEGVTIPGVTEVKLAPLKHGFAIIYSLSIGALPIALFFRQ